MLELELGTPVDWNIVIAGAWNIAILTPEGIAKRLFNLDSGTPVEVQVAVNVRAPIQVKYDDIIVQPAPSALVILPQTSSPELLKKSVNIAKRALKDLPETPLSAVGLNIRFQFDNIPDALINACNSVIDNKLSDENLKIMGKVLKRQVEWKKGELNIEIHEKQNSSAHVLFNFNKNSNNPAELSEWLEKYEDMLLSSTEIKEILINE